MDDLLYDIGLCLTPSSDEPNERHFFRTPFVIFSLSLMFITQKLLTIFCENEFILLVVFGDISHYYGFTMQVLLNIFLSLQMALVPTSQVIYYSNHKAGIEPTFLRVFRLINNPTDNGVIDQLEIDKIKSLSKTLTKLVLFVKVNIKTFYTFCVGFNLVPIMLHGYSLAHSIILDPEWSDHIRHCHYQHLPDNWLSDYLLIYSLQILSNKTEKFESKNRRKEFRE